MSKIDVTAARYNLLFFDESVREALKDYDFDEDGHLSLQEFSFALEELYFHDTDLFQSIRNNIMSQSSLPIFEAMKKDFLILEENFPAVELEDIKEGSKPANLKYWFDADIVGRFGVNIDADEENDNAPEGAFSMAELRRLYEQDPNKFRIEISKIEDPELKQELTVIYSKFMKRDIAVARNIFRLKKGDDIFGKLKNKLILFQGCDRNSAAAASMPIELMTGNIISGLQKMGLKTSDFAIISHHSDGNILAYYGGLSRQISPNELGALMRISKLYDKSGNPMTFKKVVYLGHGHGTVEAVNGTRIKGYAHVDIDHSDETYGDVTFDFDSLDLHALVSGHYLIFSCAAFINSGIDSADILGVTRVFAKTGDYGYSLDQKSYGSTHLASFVEYMSSFLSASL